MQCGSSLLASFLAFDLGGVLVCVPRSGDGASGGVGAVSGWMRDELSCGVLAGACAQSPDSPENVASAMSHLRWFYPEDLD
jgi:hypothetical protein